MTACIPGLSSGYTSVYGPRGIILLIVQATRVGYASGLPGVASGLQCWYPRN